MANANTAEEDNVTPMLRLMRGGKGPPIGGGINWLNGLDKGTAFSCKRKGNSDNLEIFVIAFKYDRTIILVDGLNNNHRIPVDPEDFCKKYTYWETIGQEEAVEQPVGDQDDSEVRSGRMADDEDAEGRHPPDAGT